MIKAVWNWFTKNFSTLFVILGVILTLWFGVYYIPHRIREAQTEKIANAQRAIEQSVKELAFSDSAVNFLEIKFLIDAKEIEMNEKFPLSIPQVLTLAQQSFMNDNFLPLLQRKELIGKLENLKSSLPKTMQEAANRNYQGPGTLSAIGMVLSIVASIIIALLGAFSLFMKQKREVEMGEELANEMDQTGIALTIQKHYAYETEGRFIAALKKTEGLHLIDYPKGMEAGTDVHFIYKNKPYYVSFQFLTGSKIGLSTLKSLFHFAGDKQGELWLIYNTDLTPMVRHQIKKINQNASGVVFRAIKVNSAEEFEKITTQLLHTV